MQELEEEDVTGILHNLIEFLECLDKVDLPDGLHSMRESLLAQSRASLQLQKQQKQQPHQISIADSSDETGQSQNYVNTEVQSGQCGSLQDYYETFQDFEPDDNKKKYTSKTETEKEMDNLLYLYAGFTAAQAKDKAIKSGPLTHLKGERKMFAPFNVFWLNRPCCWVSLVGSHLLLYANERESRPYLVVPMLGYKSQAAPGALARDPKRSKAAFEIYSPGNQTFQFVAKNNQEMKHWVQALSECSDTELDSQSKSRAATVVKILELGSNERMCIKKIKEEKEKYQDVLNSPMPKSKGKLPVSRATTPEKEKVELVEEEVLSIPIRTRRLPSLPPGAQISFEPKQEPYEEERIYYRIEEIIALRDDQNYQFRPVQTEKENSAVASVDLLQETYNDVNAQVIKSRVNSEESTVMYNDVQNGTICNDSNESSTYEDVHDSAEDLRTKSGKDKSPKAPKSSQKRSFFDRVRIRKESMKRDNKKAKSPSPTTPTTPTSTQVPTTPTIVPSTITITTSFTADNESELRSYDDISTIIKCAVPEDTDDIYADIGSSIEVKENGSFSSDLQLSIEYYQVSKSSAPVVILDDQEDNYDDVTHSETFENRQQDSVISNSDKSIRGRLGSGRQIFDPVAMRPTSSAGDSNNISTSESTFEDQ